MIYSMYHCHDYYSNPIAGVDSVVSPKQYVNRAKELGFKNFGFANHGNVYNWIEHKDLVEAAGMKYIHACELYLTMDHAGVDKKTRDNFHLVAISKNWDGVKELNRMVSKAFNRNDHHFYYMPRVSFDELEEISDNIMITTACVASPLGIKSTDESREKMINFLANHRKNCYLEIQHHCCDKQREYNQYLLKLSQGLGIPLIAGTDTHCLDIETEYARGLMQKAMDVHYSDEETFNLRLLSDTEIGDEYTKQAALPGVDWLEAIEETNRMASRVEEFELDKSFKYPHIYDNAEEVFWGQIVDGFKNHPYASKRYTWSEVEPRCREEFEVMRDTGAIDFMLLQAYVRKWEKENGVHTGFGRGSVGGSFVAYLLGITDIDSIKYGLSFSRFMSRERVNLADIDTDYDEESREKTRDFMMNRHLDLPQMESTEIITFGTMATRKAIEYMGKAFDLPLEEVKEIKGRLGEDDEIPDSLREKYPEMFKYVDDVRGVVINTSSHASGHVVTDRNIAEELGICTNANDEYPICAQEMTVLDRYNWVKFDLLGLRTLQLINLCAEYVGLPCLTPDSPEIGDLQDEKVYESLQKDSAMIFQYESDMAYAFIKQFFSKQTIDKIQKRLGNVDFARMGAIATAALRPAGTSYRDKIAHGDFVDYDLEPMQKFLDPTFGRLIFQESITGFLVEFCGYTSGKADVVRRLVAKKHPEDLEKVLPEIEEGFVGIMGNKYGLEEERALSEIKPFIQTIIDASSYAFNEAHSLSYHGLSYISCWERYYYPLEWACAGLNAYNGYDKQTISITNWCKRNGINIKPVRFGQSRAGYSFNRETNEIYKGADSVKRMNVEAAESLYKLSQNPPETFTGLLYRIKEEKACKTDQTEVLIKIGYFADYGEINALLQIFSVFQSYYKTDNKYKRFKNLKIDKLDAKRITSFVREYAERETDKTLMNVNMQAMLEKMEENFKLYTPYRKIKDIIEDQKELLGYIDLQDPKYRGMGYVEEISTKFAPRMKMVGLSNGKILNCRTYKNLYNSKPIKEGDIIFIISGRSKVKQMCVDPVMKVFKPDPSGEKEYWIEKYNIVKGL